MIKGDKGEFILYQPGEANEVELTYSKDGSKVETIEDRKLKLSFNRFDIKTWKPSKK